MNFYCNDDLREQTQWVVEDDQVHHFKNVQRGKEGDTVKVFNGKGLIYSGRVTEVKKKKLIIELIKHTATPKPKNGLTLILGTPKREYIESIFRSATQIGLSQILLVETKFSPQKFSMSERYKKILRSSLLQSENPWMPEIGHLESLKDLEQIQDTVVVFSTELNSQAPALSSRPGYFIIGPEGGFHQEELDYLTGLKNTSIHRCDTPIMKAEIAVPYCAAFVRSLGAAPQ